MDYFTVFKLNGEGAFKNLGLAFKCVKRRKLLKKEI